MQSFEGRLAVVTGGGTGMGRELVIQLAAEGCSVAACDINLENLEETARRAEEGAPSGTRVTTHLCDVGVEADVQRFRGEVLERHATDHVHLVFNNAGIGGGGSFLLTRAGEACAGRLDHLGQRAMAAREQHLLPAPHLVAEP